MTDTEDPEPQAVLDWCRNLVRIMKDGGIWGIPRSGVTFKFDKKNQTLILQQGTPDDPDFLATRRVFRQIGWNVIAPSPEARREPTNDSGNDATAR